MASAALSRYKNAINIANRILLANDKAGNKDRTDFYHAAWAAYVASWDSYLKTVCREFTDKSNSALFLGINNAAVVAFHGKHKVNLNLLEDHIKKFNTPNFENSRTFILSCTNVDIYAIWSWPEKNLINIVLSKYLNEAIKVRHSFAHGFPMQQIPNLASIDNNQNVTYRKAIFVRGLLNKLSSLTDKALDRELQTVYSVNF